jgi:hypothetical protein
VSLRARQSIIVILPTNVRRYENEIKKEKSTQEAFDWTCHFGIVGPLPRRDCSTSQRSSWCRAERFDLHRTRLHGQGVR